MTKLVNHDKFWRCHEHGKCKARIHSLEGFVIRTINEHTHFPSAVDIEVEKAKTEARLRAEKTFEPPSIIINKCMENMSQAGIMRLPNRQAMRKMIRRKRNEISQVPDNPKTIQELELPPDFKIYKPTPETEEKFCLMDRGIGQERILIFGRETWLDHIATSKVWYIDGTFAIEPNLFHQLYTILVKKYNGVHPIIYALLQNKQRSAYSRMVKMIKEMVPDARPDTINCDFEHAAFGTMKEHCTN